MAHYANFGDNDENSQAEGSVEGAVGFARPNENANSNTARNPHYENIYESIDQYVAGAAAVPADNIPLQQQQQPINNNNINVSNNSNQNQLNLVNRPTLSAARNHSLAYRNELYDRTNGYDVPRQAMRSNGIYAPSTCIMARRANLNLDMNPNRARYVNTINRGAYRQRSFDDTESYHYACNSNYRYENIYERIHEEPIYRNVNVAANRDNGGQVYGRLDVIGHGIGRIERHLSSSCGNIDHYNLGGHYAVLGHSHLGTVGHICLNPTNAPNNAKESGGKSLNFFSCLGRENSQSMNNICAPEGDAAASSNPNISINSTVENPVPSTSSNDAAPMKNTGAIPKMKKKTVKTPPSTLSAPPAHSTAFNRIPKSSLQWLLVNKWLPLWIGDRPDYNVLDFNFMFSRNCDGCAVNTDADPQQQQRLNELNVDGTYRDHRRFGRWTSRTMNREMHSRDIERRFASLNNPRRNYGARPSSRCGHDHFRRVEVSNDPFQRWELNSENNSFRPAIRRITDGTFPPNRQPNVGLRMQTVRAEINRPTPEQVSPPPQAQENAINGQERNSASRAVDRNNPLNSSTESTSAAQENKISSPVATDRRYSENTEDDQVSSKSTTQSEESDFISKTHSNSSEYQENDNADDDDDLTENGIDTSMRNDDAATTETADNQTEGNSSDKI